MKALALKKDLKAIRASKNIVMQNHFLLIHAQRSCEHRYIVSVTKKYSKSSVKRNHIRNYIKHIIRAMPDTYEISIILRKPMHVKLCKCIIYHTLLGRIFIRAE